MDIGSPNAPRPLAPTADRPSRPADFRRGTDQGELAPRHARYTSEFIADQFQSEGAFSLEKALAFVDGLRKTRAGLASDAFETAVSERLQRDVWPMQRAVDDGIAQRDFGANEGLKGFDLHILPSAEAVAEKIRVGRPHAEIQAAAEDFVRAYGPYYAPNTLRTRWNHDNETPRLFIPAVKRHVRKKVDPKALEASNLVAEDANCAGLGALLGREIAPGTLLSPGDVAALKTAGYDLSRLNPGVSAFWRRISVAEVDAQRAQFALQFPRPDERLTYVAPRYRSDASPKLTAKWIRDGVEYRLKVKMGSEVHSDLLSSRLREYMGFHQDQMQHRLEFKMYLGGRTYESFENDLALKYGPNDIKRVVLRRGVDPETREHWVVLRDVALELRPRTEIRATALDMGVYDGANRRELRARFLLNAFLGLGDTLTTNHRMVLVQDETGAYVPEYRFQDLGRSMGVVTVLQRPRDLLNFPHAKNKIEEYDRNFVKKDKKTGDVAVTYNDTFRHVRDDRDATYADLKWMARVITSLPEEAVRRSVAESGIPEDLVEIYSFHILRMRNRLVDAFDLAQDEDNMPGKPPISRIELPERRSIQVGEAVKNGKIEGTSYPGSIIYPKQQQTWLTLLNSGLTFAQRQKFGSQIEDHYKTKYEAAAGPLFHSEHSVGATLLDDAIPVSLGTLSLGPGLTVSLSRLVTPNPFLFSAEGKGRPYVIRDQASFSIGVSSPLVGKALKQLATDLNPKVQLLRVSIEHVHYSESVKAGYLARPKLQKIAFGDLERFAVEELGPGDVARSEIAFGLNLAVTAKLNVPIPGPKVVDPVTVGGSGALSWVRTASTIYAKDMWGALHLLLEKDRESVASAGFDLLKVNLVQLQGSLLGAHAKVSSTHQDFWDIEVVPPEYDLEKATQALAGLDRETLIADLKKVRARPELVLESEGRPVGSNIQLRNHVRATSHATAASAQALFVLSPDRLREKTNVHVETQDISRDLLKLTRGKRYLAGFEDLAVDLTNKNILVQLGTSKKLCLEMDRANPRNFVVTLDVYDYHRAIPRKDVLKLIDKLNARYSRDAETPFFRTDIPVGPDRYRKVYANARIYVNGGELLRIVEDMAPGELEAAISSAYRGLSRSDGRTHPAESADRALIRRAALRSGTALSRAVREVAELAESGAATPALEAAEEKVAETAFDFVYALYKSKYGVSLLKQLLGEEGMMVIGEIFGIHRQTNALQEDMWKNTLRFMGQSWGSLERVPPIAHYIRYDQVTAANPQVMPKVPIERFVGTVVRGKPGNYLGFGQR